MIKASNKLTKLVPVNKYVGIIRVFLMKIIVDADACPVKNEIEKIARDYGMPVVLVANINHMIASDYSQIIIVDNSFRLSY